MTTDFKSRIYLAGPFFSEAQNQRLDEVAALLASNPTVGYVFEPVKHQQDEIVAEYGNGSLAEAMKTKEWQDATYHADIQGINQANAVVAMLDFDIENGNVRPDEGTMFEIGYAIALRKPVIIVQYTQDEEPLNLMLAGSYTGFFWGKEDIQKLATYDFVNFPKHLVKKSVF